MEINELVKEWFVWRKTVDFLLEDKDCIKDHPIKLPNGYVDILDQLSKNAYERTKEQYRQIKMAGISVLGDEFDKGEHFVLWKQRGSTHLFRIEEQALRVESEMKLEELVNEVNEYWSNHTVTIPDFFRY